MIKNIIYKLLEIITPNLYKMRVYCGVPIKMPFRLRNYFSDNYESATMSFINEFYFNQDHILDIGAHVGLYTAIFAKKSKPKTRIFAFEPSKPNFDYLKKTIEINSLNNVIAYNVALSNKVGQQNFYFSKNIGFNAGSFVKENLPLGNSFDTISIEVITIDYFIESNKIKKLQLMKIDVEGFEAQVLNGGVNTLKKLKPTIILALHPKSISKNNDSLLSIWEFITSLNYKVYLDNKIINKNKFIKETQLFDVILINKSKVF